MVRYGIVLMCGLVLGLLVGRASLQSQQSPAPTLCMHSAHVILQDHHEGSPLTTEVKIPDGMLPISVRNQDGSHTSAGRALSARNDPETGAWKLSWLGTTPTEFGRFVFQADGYLDLPLPDDSIQSVGFELGGGIRKPIVLKMRRAD